jgi:hypothetical protein
VQQKIVQENLGHAPTARSLGTYLQILSPIRMPRRRGDEAACWAGAETVSEGPLNPAAGVLLTP